MKPGVRRAGTYALAGRTFHAEELRAKADASMMLGGAHHDSGLLLHALVDALEASNASVVRHELKETLNTLRDLNTVVETATQRAKALQKVAERFVQLSTQARVADKDVTKATFDKAATALLDHVNRLAAFLDEA